MVVMVTQSLLVCCWCSMKETVQLLSVIIDIVQDNPKMEFIKEEVTTKEGMYAYNIVWIQNFVPKIEIPFLESFLITIFVKQLTMIELYSIFMYKLLLDNVLLSLHRVLVI